MEPFSRREYNQQTEWQCLYNEHEKVSRKTDESFEDSLFIFCIIHATEFLLLFFTVCPVENSPRSQELLWFAAKGFFICACAYWIRNFKCLSQRTNNLISTVYLIKMLYDLLSTVVFAVYLLSIYKELSLLELNQFILWFRSFVPTEELWCEVPEYLALKMGTPLPTSQSPSEELQLILCKNILAGATYLLTKIYQIFHFVKWRRLHREVNRDRLVREIMRAHHMEQQYLARLRGYGEQDLSPQSTSPSSTTLRRR